MIVRRGLIFRPTIGALYERGGFWRRFWFIVEPMRELRPRRYKVSLSFSEQYELFGQIDFFKKVAQFVQGPSGRDFSQAQQWKRNASAEYIRLKAQKRGREPRLLNDVMRPWYETIQFYEGAEIS